MMEPCHEGGGSLSGGPLSRGEGRPGLVAAVTICEKKKEGENKKKRNSDDEGANRVCSVGFDCCSLLREGGVDTGLGDREKKAYFGFGVELDPSWSWCGSVFRSLGKGNIQRPRKLRFVLPCEPTSPDDRPTASVACYSCCCIRKKLLYCTPYPVPGWPWYDDDDDYGIPW